MASPTSTATQTPAPLRTEQQPRSSPPTSSPSQPSYQSAGPSCASLASAAQHKHFSEPRNPLSGKAYYIDGRSSAQYDAHLARPQSALVRDHKAGQISSSAHMTYEDRRPSAAQSLPPFKPGSSSTSPIPGHVRSENVSLSSYDQTFYEKRHSDRILGHPPPTDEEEPDQPWPPHTSSSLHQTNPLPPTSPSRVLSTYSLSNTGADEYGDDSMPTTRQTLRSLLHLAVCAAPLSAAIFFYSIVVIIYTMCTSPLRLCIKSRRSFRHQLTSLLIGPLNVQRRCISVLPVLPTSSRTSSSSRTPLSSDDAVESQTANFEYASIQPGKLVSIHLLAPLLALPMALCAWVMAVAWGLGVIVSDERAGDDRDERRLAQRLVDYWASWLNWGMESKPKNHSSSERRGRRRTRPEMSMVGAQ